MKPVDQAILHDPPRTHGDERLEAAIEARRQDLLRATTPEKRRDAWYTMKSLIEARSAMQIRRLERARGLRPIGDC